MPGARDLARRLVAPAAAMAAIALTTFSWTREHAAAPGPAVAAAMAKANAGDPSELLRLARAGDADAQAKVGDLYFKGGPVTADHKEARRWYEMAAKQKHPAASRVLGEMYAKGDGGRRDTKKAMELWRTAESGGDPLVSILVADQLFSELTGGKTPGPGKFAFRGGIPVGDIEVVEDWYRQAKERDPRPDVKKRADYALSVLATFKSAAQATPQRQ